MCNCDCCEDNEQEEESSFGKLPPAPPFSKTKEEMKAAMNAAFDKYPNVRLNAPAMIQMMAQNLSVQPHQFRDAENAIYDFLASQKRAGIINVLKGPRGGLMRNRPDAFDRAEARIDSKKTIAGPIYSVGASPLQNATIKPTNDRTCGCGKGVSSSEKSCWWCGAPIG